MIRILAVDTSTFWGGAALLESDGRETRVISEAGLLVEDGMAARLLPLVASLTGLAGWSKTSIDLYAAARGPGSFTGLRIGLGLIEGLAIASGRPCVGVGTLDAVAETAGPAEAERLPLIGAGRGNVYGALFDATASPPRSVEPPWVGLPERALAAERPVVVLAPRAFLDRLAAGAGHPARIALAPATIPSGVGRIAAARAAAGLTEADAATALYVRPSYTETAER